MGKLKGQAGIEYLATYGWAIFALFIVVALLIGSGIFNPARFSGDECLFQPNIPCKSYFIAYDENSGTATAGFEVANGMGFPVIWKSAKINISGKAKEVPVSKYSGQGQSTLILFDLGKMENVRPNAPLRARLEITFLNCDGFAGKSDCEKGDAPEHTTSGRMKTIVRAGKVDLPGVEITPPKSN